MCVLTPVVNVPNILQACSPWAKVFNLGTYTFYGRERAPRIERRRNRERHRGSLYRSSRLFLMLAFTRPPNGTLRNFLNDGNSLAFEKVAIFLEAFF